MIAKYIFASLLIALRRHGIFIPECVDFMSRTCAITDTKTAMSKGTDGWFNSMIGRIRKSDETITKGEGKGYLNDYSDISSTSKTKVIWI